MTGMRSMGTVWDIVRYNGKLLTDRALLIAAGYAAVLFYILEPSLMGARDTARMGEMGVAVAGWILYPQLAYAEAGGIGEVLGTKPVKAAGLFLLRWGLASFYMALVALAFLLGIHSGGGEFPLIPLAAGTLINAAVLGTLGILTGQLTRSPPAGYLAGAAWYLLDWMTKGKLTGVFYLFGMSSDGAWDPDKWWLAGAAGAGAILCAIVHKRMLLM